LKTGIFFSNIEVKEGNFYFLHKFSNDIKSLSHGDEFFKNIYDAFIRNKNSGKYMITFQMVISREY